MSNKQTNAGEKVTSLVEVTKTFELSAVNVFVYLLDWMKSDKYM